MTRNPSTNPKAITWRSGGTALLLLGLWVVGGCMIATSAAVGAQQILMILGFGAILTIFLLQFPLLFMATTIVVWVGVFANQYYVATPGDYPRLVHGILVTLPILAALIGLSLWLRWRPLFKGELTIIYACLVVGIPWCICVKAVLESSVANLFELQRNSEPHVYHWAREMPWWAPAVPPYDPPAPSPGALEARAALLSAHGAGPSSATRVGVAMALDGVRQQALRQSAADAEARQAEIIDGFTRGNGGQVPWSMWIRPVAFWLTMCLAFEAMLMGLILMFRRRWIEHERLPFVWSYPAMEIIEPQSPGGWRRWAPFLLGLALCLPGIILISPTGEAASSWIVPPWAGRIEGIRGGMDLTSLNLLPNMTLRLAWGPVVLALFLMFPVDILLTVGLTFVVLNLLIPQILLWMGIQIGPTRLGEFVGWGLRFGGGLGLLFWSLWFNRRAVWGYVRSLWGRPPTNIESQDVLGRRKIVLMAIGGTVVFIALAFFSARATVPEGAPFYYAFTSPLVQVLVLVAMVLVFVFAQLRERIEGMPLTYENNLGSHGLVSVQRDILHDHYTRASDQLVTGTGWSIHWMQWGFSGLLKSYGPQNMLLEAFKVGHELKVNARAIGLAILVTMLLVAAITPVVYLKTMYTYGFENSYSGGLSTWNSFTQWSERGASYGMHSTSAVFVQPGDNLGFYEKYRMDFNILYGFALVGILFYLRREYTRFPIHPVGVVLAAEQFAVSVGVPFSPAIVWFSFLLAGVVKLLIFRWVGVRSYREKIQPLVILFLCGLIYGMMLFLFRQVSIGSGFVQ